jgi:hypothetical protein
MVLRLIRAAAGLHSDIATMGYHFLERVLPDFSIKNAASPASFAYNTAQLLTQRSWQGDVLEFWKTGARTGPMVFLGRRWLGSGDIHYPSCVAD